MNYKYHKAKSLILIVVFLLCIVAPTSASAAGPYFKVKAVSGTEKVLGSGEKVKITVKLKNAESKLYVSALRATGPVISCTGATGSGEISNFFEGTNRREGRLEKGEIVFTKCSMPGAGTCFINGKRSGEGTITLEHVMYRIGFVPGKTTVIGNILPAAGTTFGILQITECDYPEEPFKLKGMAAGTVSPVGSFAKSFTVGAKVNAKLEQEIKEIEFPEYNEETKKTEKQTEKGELEFGKHAMSIEDEVELAPPAGTEMEIATT